jgi:hypothetical protein
LCRDGALKARLTVSLFLSARNESRFQRLMLENPVFSPRRARNDFALSALKTCDVKHQTQTALPLKEDLE